MIHIIHMKQAFRNAGAHSDLNADICPRLCPGSFLVSVFVYVRPVFKFLTEGGKPGGPGAVWLAAWLGLAGPCWGLAGAWPGPRRAQAAAHGNPCGPGEIH